MVSSKTPPGTFASETTRSRRWDFKKRERNTWNEVLIGMTGELK
jgi:hypothetical protein